MQRFLAWFRLNLQTPQKDVSNGGCYLINIVMLKKKKKKVGEEEALKKRTVELKFDSFFLTPQK